MSTRSLLLSKLAGAATALWTVGAGVRAWLYEKRILKQKRLRAKVISIGNITWGGTGKTPFTIWLARRMQEAGLRVSILTRGYGRTSSERVKILPAGTTPPQARNDGDEVQLYLRHLRNVPIGISASRYEAGRRVEEEGELGAHLLDDGFQHLGLARDVDLVLIDASNPWGGRRGSAKLLRESVNALRRANAILLMRCELAEKSGRSRGLEELQAALREASPAVPQFLVRTRLGHFADREEEFTYAVSYMRHHRTVAFCGLGNPDNFFNMLELEGIRPLVRKVFCDHHRYSIEDVKLIEKLAQENRADCLLTTEKDLVNLPSNADFSVPLDWAVTDLVVQEEERLLEWIRQKLDFAADGQASVNSRRHGKYEQEAASR